MQTNASKLELVAMRRELDALQAKLAALEDGHDNQTDLGSRILTATDRRGMLKKVAGLAAGVAAGGLLQPKSSQAADGDTLILGATSNRANTDTRLSVGSPAAAFEVRGFSSSVLNDSVLIGRNVGNNSWSAPAEKLGIWGQADSRDTTTPDAAVAGVFGSARGGRATGVIGDGSSVGVRGVGSTGVDGVASGNPISGIGVRGIANVGTSLGAGVVGTSIIGVGGLFTGRRAAVSLQAGSGAVADPNVAPPVAAFAGDVYCSSGTTFGLWYKAGAGTNPYRRLADSTTAGALSVLVAPLRLIDTRNGSGFFDAGNHYSNGNTRVYNIVSLSANAIPPGARAIVARATALNSTASAIIQESPVNPPGVGSEIINLGAGQIVGAAFTSALNSSGAIIVKATTSSGTVDVILDVIGYYL